MASFIDKVGKENKKEKQIMTVIWEDLIVYKILITFTPGKTE